MLPKSGAGPGQSCTSRPLGRNQTKKLPAFSFCCKFRIGKDPKTCHREENAVKSFIQKYENDVMGSLSGFDRLVFRGTLRRRLYPQGMDYCLAFLGVLLKDFAQYVLQVTARLKEASLAAARRSAPHPIPGFQSNFQGRPGPENSRPGPPGRGADLCPYTELQSKSNLW